MAKEKVLQDTLLNGQDLNCQFAFYVNDVLNEYDDYGEDMERCFTKIVGANEFRHKMFNQWGETVEVKGEN